MLTRHACFALALVTTACTSGPTLEEAPAELADAWCQNLEACAPLPIFTPEQCRTQFAGLFRATLFENADELISRGTTSYDAAAAAGCIEAYRALGCDLVIAATPPECRVVLVGGVEDGGSCSDSTECQAGSYCDAAACPTTRGTCAARKANGATCLSDDECEDGLACEDGSCGPPASQSGGPCGGDSGRECPIDELCRGAEGTSAGTCTPFESLLTAALGEDCSVGEEDTMILCQRGSSCAVVGLDGTAPDFECVAGVGEGAPCNAAVPEMCPLGQRCDANPRELDFEGTCVPMPTAGQPCAEVLLGSRCAAGLACASIDGAATCVRVLENGATCGVGAECFSGNCDDGVCSGPPICPPA